MPEPFDPYYHWLGIPPQDQPPDHYRLLSLQQFEPNADVIQNAVDRMMVHLRTFQTGRRAAESQKLLTEVSRAKICLLNPAKKAEYDRGLKTRQPPRFSPIVEPLIEPVAGPPSSNQLSGADVPIRIRSAPLMTARARRRRRRRITLALIGILVVLIGAGMLIWRTRFARDALAPSSNHAADEFAASTNTGSKRNSGPPDVAGNNSDQSDPPSVAHRANLPANPSVQPSSKTGGSAATHPSASSIPSGAGAAALEPAIVAKLRAAAGVVTHDMALVQNLAWDEFMPLAEQMRPFGYRPVRLRPYVDATTNQVLAACIWKRDGMQWRVASSDSEKTLSKLSGTLMEQSWVPVDLAGFTTDRTYFVALFVQTRDAVVDVQVDIGIGGQQRDAISTRRKNGSYVLSAMQEFTDRTGATRYCEIWSHSESPRSWSRTSGLLMRDRPILADSNDLLCPLDLTLAVHGTGPGESVYWTVNAVRAAEPVAILSGFTPAEHVQEARELARQGYQPIALAVVSFEGQLIAASAWQMPAGQQAEDRPMLVQHAGGLPAVGGSLTPGPNNLTPPDNTPNSAAVARSGVPTDSVLDNSRQQLDAKYGETLKQATNTTGRAAAAGALLSIGAEEPDVTLRYLVYRTARDLALQAGHVDLTLRAIDALSAGYRVDPMAMKEEAIRELLTTVKRPSARYALAWLAFELSEQARTRQLFTEAEQIATVASNAARTIRDRRLSRAALAQKKRIDSAAQLLAVSEAAKQMLASDPNAADANLSAGKYSCFVNGQWPKGLALLAKGSDKTLAKLAEQDLAAPVEPLAQLTLAEAWDDWSKGQKQEPQIGAMQRALDWYTRAVHGLAGDQQLAAEQKLMKIDDRLAPWLWSAARKVPWFDGPPGVVHTLAGSGVTAPTAAAPHNGRYAVLGYRTGDLVVWDLITGHERARHRGVLKSLGQIVMAGNSSIVVCGNLTRDLVLCDLGSGKATLQQQPHSVSRIAAAEWEPVFAWTVAAGQTNNVITWHAGLAGRQPSYTSAYVVRAVALSPDGRSMIVGDDQNQLTSWDLALGKQLGRTVLAAPPQSLQISPDGRFLLVGVENKFVVYGTADGNDLGHLPDEYHVAAFLPHGGRLVAAGLFLGRLDVWDLRAHRVVGSVSVHNGTSPVSISRIVPLCDPRAVIVTSRNGSAYLVLMPDPIGTASDAARGPR